MAGRSPLTALALAVALALTTTSLAAPVPVVVALAPTPAPEVWTCSVCKHVYDAAKDDPAKKNTPFEQLPATWKCPVCGAPKSKYVKSATGEWYHEHDEADAEHQE